MARFHTTTEGNIPFTAEEEAEFDAMEANHEAQKDAKQAKKVRATRDTKLSDTDWRFRSDMTPSQAWKDYCQALRDVPTQAGFPWTITWPVEPQ
jgi:hypothetical protein